MNDIQQARDVLAKWRDGTTPGPWRVSNSGNWVTSDADDIARAGIDSTLIVGTAGNPALWDAIDGFLAMVGSFELRDRQQHAHKIAAAIIAADERMNA